MRILHISDLHIGAHNENLLTSLTTRVDVMKPDVIVATGDFADRPSADHLIKACDYLKDLAKLCPQRRDGVATLIVVPGNHDIGYFKGNLALRNSNYQMVFGSLPTASFYPSERIWIYGFNSARERGVGANGDVLQSDLTLFDNAFEIAKREHPRDFASAYKIVALHHHPLPIRYDAKYSRWVTLLNSAEFLEQMLKHDIDLIIHGHEHVHAQAKFGKRFQGQDRSLTVVSVGTVSHRNPGDDRNRFNVIEIATNGSIQVDSYEAKGGTFDAKPVDSYVVRDTMESNDWRFNQFVAEKGYKYTGLIARAMLNVDGDVERSVEFRDLDLKDAHSERARIHNIALPQTSGYIDIPTAWEILDGGEVNELTFTRSSAVAGDKRVEGTIEYGRTLTFDVPFSLLCKWWAVNAMAMSNGQSRKKYSERRPQEYTHFPILDPVEQMTCTLNFPPGFTPIALRPFVARVVTRTGEGLHVDVPDSALEHQLRGSVVLDGFGGAGTRSTLQIRKPAIGYTYGFRWTLPDEQEPDTGVAGAEADEIVASLLAFRAKKDPSQREKIARAVGLAGEYLRARLAPDFVEHLEFGLMVFDARERKMVTVAACLLRDNNFEWLDHDHLVFDYGEGIGGRAFKTKLPRLYVESGSHASRRTEPDYYRKVDNDPGYAVLFALPIHHPKLEASVYAALCCGSYRTTCPLRELGRNGSPITGTAVKAAQLAVNLGLYGDLMKISKHEA